MHDSFIAHYHPTLISSNPGSPARISDGDVWGRGRGYYKAGVSMLWLAGGIHLICCDYYRVCSHTPPPRSARPDCIRTQQCAVCVPGRISALHREERISVTTQLICIHVPREPHEHPGLHIFHIKRGTSITETPLDLLSLLWQDLIGNTVFLDSFKWFPDSSLYFIFFVMSLFNWDNAINVVWYRLALSIKEFSLHFLDFSAGFFHHFVWETAAPECHLESPTRFTRKRSPWCKRPSERPIRRIFWRRLWGWGWGHRNLQPLSGSHLNY